MNDVGGSESGTGPLGPIRAVKSSRTSDTNFDAYDDEWDVGIGNLIIDLDADIEKNNEANRTGSSSSTGGTVTTTTTTGNSVGASGQQQQQSATGSSSQMHIPRSPSSGNNSGGSLTTTLKSSSVKVSGAGGTATTAATLASSTSNSSSTPSSASSLGGGSGNGKSLTTPSDLSKSLASVSMEHSATVVEKGLKMKIKRSKPGTKSVDAKHEIVKSDVTTLTSGGNTTGGGSAASGGKNASLTIPVSESKLSSAHGKDKLQQQQEKDNNNTSNSGSSSNNTNSSNNTATTTGKSEDSSGSGSSSNNSSGNNSNNDQGGPGVKVKPPKRGSTHKKVKSGGAAATTTTATISSPSSGTTNNSSGSNNKKDMTISDTKASSNSTSSASHVKDMIFNVSVGSTPGGISAPTSAFVKTSAATASSVKGVATTTSSGSLLGHTSDTIGNSTTTTTATTQGSAFRSQHSASSNASSWAPGGSPAKETKGQGRLSPSVTTPNASEKLSNTTNSPSYGKKPRVFAQPDKSSSSSSMEDTVSHPHGNIISGPNSSSSTSSYRTSVTLSSASLNDLNTSSCSSSILHQANTALSQPGATVLSSFNSTKDAPKTGQRTSVGTATDIATVTEPDCLGPCEPGTSVTLEGIVWHETESGVLVVNVTWRGKTYVGTLLDCTKNDWAPPRFCDSPTSDLEMRNPKNRGKRGRAQTTTPVNDPSPADNARTGNTKLRNGVKGRRGSSTAFVTPVSPLKPDPWPKRKTRGSENESQEETPTAPKNAKRPKVSSSSKDNNTNTLNSKDRQSSSPAPAGNGGNANSTTAMDVQSGPFSPALIECPEPNCSKKYKHINGLRYHQSHAHSNNFTPEDSDSNMSTASTTNATNLSLDAKVDGVGGNTESVDATIQSDSSRVDVDMEIDSTTTTPTTTTTTTATSNADGTENTSSTPPSSTTTPPITAKRNSNNNTAPLSGSKIVPVDSQTIKETTIPVVVPITTCTVSRTPILTVPVPFSSLSLQNRPIVHGHHHGHGTNNLGTIPRSSSETLVNDKSNALNRDDVSVMKTQVVTVPSSTNSTVSKGAPWQPHAHSHSSSPHGPHTAHVISSLHSQQQQSITNIPVPLTVPVISASLNKDHDKNKTGIKDKSPSDSSILQQQQQQQTKKQKHKKKSKEKDRERGGRNGDGSKNGNNSSSSKTFSGQNSADKGKDMTDKRSSSFDESDKDGKGGDRDGAGENRDDPQSPAYSDISDANESGPESDLNVGGGTGGGVSVASNVKDNCVKSSLPAELTNKKDSVVGVGIPPGHSISSFFPSFYSPYNLDSTSNPGSTPSSGNNPNNLTPNKPDGSRPNIVSEEPLSTVESNKTKGKSSSSSHPHIHGHHGHGNHPSHSNVPPSSLPPSAIPTDDRRSPKVDYNLSNKYLPQHYFAHYPYTNPYAAFDQPYGPSILSENSYPSNHNRVFMEEKEREIQMSNESRGPLKKPGDKDESPIHSLIGNIKLEPGAIDRSQDKDRDRRDKEMRSMVMDKESQEMKGGEFGENIYGEKRSSLNLLPPQHFMPCSKHSKDAKRDREDRHSSNKDGDMTKETGQMKSGSGRNSVEGKSNKSLNLDRDHRDGNNDGDKDGKDKNEGMAKPTMETQGPPPPPTGSYAYIPQSYLQGGFGIPFDPSHPLYRQVLVPGPYPGSPYMHPGSIPRYPPTGPGSTPLPEDLSRPSGSGPPGSAKALDLLQHHAAQYYASHKIHELQERALKSPSPQVPGPQGPGGVGQNLSATPSSPGGLIVSDRPVRGNIGGGGSGGTNSGSAPGTALSSNKAAAADLTKDSKPVILGGLPGQPSESRSPPTQHHVHSHTHHHTHVGVGIGYPLINSAVPPQYSPHYGVLTTPSSVTAVAASVITPYPSSQKPN